MKHGIILLVFLFALLPTPSFAQNTPFAFSGDTNQPIEITADDSIEWLRETHQYKATGHAIATQGKNSVISDTLTAVYDPDKGQSEITSLIAEGSVVMSDGIQTIKGDKAVYIVESGQLTVTGKGVSLTTPTQTVTASKSLEYFDKEQKAIATGNVKASDEKNTLYTEKLVTYFAKQDGKTVLKSAETFNGTRIITPSEIVLGDHGIYDAITEKARIIGDVKITRGENQLDGAEANLDTKTGISQIFGGKGENKTRVRALFVPDKKDNTTTP